MMAGDHPTKERGLLAAVTGDGASADDLSVRRWGAARAALARATDKAWRWVS